MDWKNMWENSRSTIISGIIAIVVIAGLFVLFNSVPASKTDKKSDKQGARQDQKKTEENKKTNDGSKDVTGKISLPTTYKVASGDSLWTISEKYYGTGYSWVVVAKENKLSNPNVIHAGNVLTIPKSTATIAAVPTSYTVVKGDSLWNISKHFYGSGAQWTKIRDANPGKIGTLSNGRPLITPGQILKIQ